MKFIRYWRIGGSVVSSAVNHYPTYNVNYFFLEGITVMYELRLFYLYDLWHAPADLLLLTSECWDWHVGLWCRAELCARSLMPHSCSEECWTSRIFVVSWSFHYCKSNVFQKHCAKSPISPFVTSKCLTSLCDLLISRSANTEWRKFNWGNSYLHSDFLLASLTLGIGNVVESEDSH